MKDLIKDELNVKEMVLTTEAGELVEYEIKPNLALLGPKYGRDLGAIRQALEGIDPGGAAEAVAAGRALAVGRWELLPEEVLLSARPRPGYAVAEEGGYMVGVSTEITPELAAEGLARELVHRLQTMRRSAGFEIADYIETYYQGDPEIERVMAAFSDYVRQETLSRSLIAGSPPDGAYVERHRLDGREVTLGVRR